MYASNLHLCQCGGWAVDQGEVIFVSTVGGLASIIVVFIEGSCVNFGGLVYSAASFKHLHG